jgi:hypothetical protein
MIWEKEKIPVDHWKNDVLAKLTKKGYVMSHNATILRVIVLFSILSKILLKIILDRYSVNHIGTVSREGTPIYS